MDHDPEYKIGDRIRLLSMPDDPDPLPIGATGMVVGITEGPMAQVGVDWDNGRSLMLIPGVDQVEVIVDDENLVGEDSACPQCHNRLVDALVWDEEYGEFVTCLDCGMVYGPDGGPYAARAVSAGGDSETDAATPNDEPCPT